MTKNTNSKQRYDIVSTDYSVSVIEILNFEFVWNLVLVYWYFAIKCIKKITKGLNRGRHGRFQGI